MKNKLLSSIIFAILISVIISSCGVYRGPVLGEKLYRTVDYMNAPPLPDFAMFEIDLDPCGCEAARKQQNSNWSHRYYPPICGIDGNTYASSCDAKCNGFFEWRPGRCDRPAPQYVSSKPESNTTNITNVPTFDSQPRRTPRKPESNSNDKPTTSHYKPINNSNDKATTTKKTIKR